MKKPVATLPEVEEMAHVPKMPRQTGRWQKTPIGGRMGSSKDDMAGDAQIKDPAELPGMYDQGHAKTAIPSGHIFGQRHAGGAATPDGYKMHLNPHDMARNQNSQSDVKVPTVKIPKQPRLKTPKV